MGGGGGCKASILFWPCIKKATTLVIYYKGCNPLPLFGLIVEKIDKVL